jgi:hypothetical protein
MRKNLTLLLFAAFVFVACKKNKSELIIPVADFAFAGDTTHSIIFGPYDVCTLVNKSTNADSYIWDLGNGVTSRSENFLLNYPLPGKYKISLTAINSNGKTSTAVREVTIVNPVLKQVVIEKLDWNSGWGRPVAWPVFSKANVWVEILKGEPGKDYPLLSNGSYDAPVVFKSQAVNLDSTSVPFVFNIPSKIDLDIPALTGLGGYTGRGYGFNLYARDNTGVYLLCSSYWGIGTLYNGTYSSGKFSIRSGVFALAFSVNGIYE